MNTVIVRVYPINGYLSIQNLSIGVKNPTFLEFVDAVEKASKQGFMAVDIFADEGQFIRMAPWQMLKKIYEITNIEGQYFEGSKTYQLYVKE